MSNFTKGKWEAIGHRILVNGYVLARVNWPNNLPLITAAPEMYELLQEVAGTSVPCHYVGHFLGLKNKARGLLARIDGDSDVTTKESEP